MRYIILILSLYTPLHCMKSLIEKESLYRFKNITILSYDGWEENAILMAKNATLVHSNTKTDVGPKKHPDIQNLFFRQPQHNAYDLVTIYDPYMLNKKNIIAHLKAIHDYLAPSGKFCFFIRTKKNSISVPEQLFATVYTEKYQPITTLQSNYFIDDELKKIIWANGYNIVSYEDKIYKTVIQDKYNYLENLAITFVENMRHRNLSISTMQEFMEQFMILIMQHNEEHNPGQLIESWNFTKITLTKTDQLRPPLFINNSLLSKEYS